MLQPASQLQRQCSCEWFRVPADVSICVLAYMHGFLTVELSSVVDNATSQAANNLQRSSCSEYLEDEESDMDSSDSSSHSSPKPAGPCILFSKVCKKIYLLIPFAP